MQEGCDNQGAPGKKWGVKCHGNAHLCIPCLTKAVILDSKTSCRIYFMCVKPLFPQLHKFLSLQISLFQLVLLVPSQAMLPFFFKKNTTIPISRSLFLSFCLTQILEIAKVQRHAANVGQLNGTLWKWNAGWNNISPRY